MAPLAVPQHDVIGYIYAALLIGGGLLGAIRRGSLVSLLAGTLAGAGAGYGAYSFSRDPADVRLAIIVPVAMTLLMGSRFLRSGKFMPAGMITALSVLMTLRYGKIGYDAGVFRV